MSGALRQCGFRFFNDDGTVLNDATFYEAENVNIKYYPLRNIRLRIGVVSSGSLTTAFTLQYQKNGTGSYANVPTSVGSNELYASDSSLFTNHTATTPRLSGPGGPVNFTAGEGNDTVVTTNSISLNAGVYTELEFCIKFATSALFNVYSFRLTSSGSYVYDYSPSVTLIRGPVKLGISGNDLTVSGNSFSVSASDTVTRTYGPGTTSITFPPLTTRATIKCGAAGGSGSNSAVVVPNSAGGGGGGSYAEKTIIPTIGVGYTINVGNSALDQNGGDTKFSLGALDIVVAKGGYKGSTNVGGAGGTFGTGDITYNGGNGGQGNQSGSNRYGGGGGEGASSGSNGNNASGAYGQAGGTGTAGGDGGNGANGSTPATAGAVPSGGGGGGNSSGAGKLGAPGYMIITYTY
jgi:hypothetical protein